ncbi:MAG: hypothetical protein VYE77_00005, partial [Planctomycetota bacterium]|nr:hypothetical protein [Planctomycetota bacterium]
RDPVRATRLNPSLPRDLQAILDRGLARNRSQRYATIAEFAADLRAFLDHQPGRARPLTLAQRTWRRARRSPAFRVGVLVAAAAVLTAVSFDAYASWQQQRQTEAARAWGRIPPTLTLEHPNNRLVVDLQARGAIAQQLDEAVAASVEPVPARLVRAAFRLDHGDPAGAAADMAEVAQQLDSDYGRSLANRYASLPATADSIGDLDLGGLPAPTSATGQFIDAFHALRRRSSRDDFAKAQRLLASPELADYPPAVEIALQIQLDSAGRERDRALRLTAFRQLHDAAVRLETARGASAMTAHLCAAALAGQERYQEAAVEVLRGLEYSPHAHGLHVNAGTIFRRLAQLTRAGKHLQRVIDLRPQTLNAYQTLIWVHLENRAFAAAQELIDQAPWPDSRAGLRRQRQLQGHLEHEQALALWTAGQPDAAREAARRAIATFEEAQELGFPGGTFEVAVCRGLLDGSGEAVTALLESLTTEPVNWRRIAAVQALLPESLDADQTLALGQYLQALRRHLAPGEPRQTPAPPQPSRAR